MIVEVSCCYLFAQPVTDTVVAATDVGVRFWNCSSASVACCPRESLEREQS
jgi:hypothetical protein